MDEKNFLVTEKLSTLMRKYSLPCIISLVVAALYNIVDQIFIANASYLGSYGNAANTVVYPLTVVALSLAVMIGDGCCAFVSISLGEKKEKDAGDSIGSAVLLSIIVSLVVTAVYLLFAHPIVSMFGATVNEKTYDLSREYFFWITLGVPFYIFGQAMNPIIRSDGSPKFAMVATVSGAIVNIFLDPIFIYVFGWGMMGAAIATVLGQILTAALSVWYLCHGMKMVQFGRENLRLFPKLIRRFIPLGGCSFFSQISLVLCMAATQYAVVKYSGMDPIFSQAQYSQIPMACIGIIMKCFQIVISIAIGMAAGCIPVAGFNLGAGRDDRVANLFSRLLICEFIVGLVALVIFQVFPHQIIALFGSANESSYYTDFAVRCFRIYLCMMPLAAVNKATFIYLQAMGKAVLSTVLSIIREVVFGIAFVLLLPHWFGLNGVLYSMPVSDVLTFIISIVLVVQIYRTLHRDYQEKQAALRPVEQQG